MADKDKENTYSLYGNSRWTSANFWQSWKFGPRRRPEQIVKICEFLKKIRKTFRWLKHALWMRLVWISLGGVLTNSYSLYGNSKWACANFWQSRKFAPRPEQSRRFGRAQKDNPGFAAKFNFLLAQIAFKSFARIAFHHALDNFLSYKLLWWCVL